MESERLSTDRFYDESVRSAEEQEATISMSNPDKGGIEGNRRMAKKARALGTSECNSRALSVGKNVQQMMIYYMQY
ncbi:hypothetical protein ACJROX_16695 [Pseudalkalibacillus sp. A8]|uniref:hypothetical protein n=1 Tax=Pseudalkalibacillus sp. A8 TaxID=3382641 RepID=UPI0038B51C3C